MFSKNCSSPQRLLPHFIINPAPHCSQRSSTKVRPKHEGQTTYSERPHPAQTTSSFSMERRQVGHRYPKGLLLAHFGHNRESLSMNSPQCKQGCLYVAMNYPPCFVPHSPQKRVPDSSSAPQLLQCGFATAPSLVPHSWQNFVPSGF